ncbi:hypothetical protein [Photobacterium phosphoreum]|nr:hypothetical protein [Photobacterium phosphoreum]
MEKSERKVIENPFSKKENWKNPGVTMAESRKRIREKVMKRCVCY